jgi:hypothetical protein
MRGDSSVKTGWGDWTMASCCLSPFSPLFFSTSLTSQRASERRNGIDVFFRSPFTGHACFFLALSLSPCLPPKSSSYRLFFEKYIYIYTYRSFNLSVLAHKSS